MAMSFWPHFLDHPVYVLRAIVKRSIVMTDEHVCLGLWICLSVCVSTSTSLERNVRTSPKFLCTLLVPADCFSFGDEAIRYVGLTAGFIACPHRRNDTTAASCSG